MRPVFPVGTDIFRLILSSCFHFFFFFNRYIFIQLNHSSIHHPFQRINKRSKKDGCKGWNIYRHTRCAQRTKTRSRGDLESCAFEVFSLHQACPIFLSVRLLSRPFLPPHGGLLLLFFFLSFSLFLSLTDKAG